jgi:hypothetical protein
MNGTSISFQAVVENGLIRLPAAYREKTAGAIMIITLTGDGSGRINHERTYPLVFIREIFGNRQFGDLHGGNSLKRDIRYIPLQDRRNRPMAHPNPVVPA